VPPVMTSLDAGSGPLLVTVTAKYWYPVTCALGAVVILVARSADAAVAVRASGWGFLSFAAAAGAEGATATSAKSVTRTVSFGEIAMRRRWDMMSSLWVWRFASDAPRPPLWGFQVHRFGKKCGGRP
jgi:hypothetical protein